MKTNNELLALQGVIDPQTGILWAVDRQGGWTQVTDPAGVNPDFQHVISASLIMYSTLHNASIGLGKIVTLFEAIGIEEAVISTTQLQAGVNVTLRCAIEGLDKIAKGSEKRS